jgi:uncharacterized repeat protein (TIGR03803 family)
MLLLIIQSLEAQTEKTVYTFEGKADGGYPMGGLLRDAAGNLYGTAEYGGTGEYACQPYCGVLFELELSTHGTWSEKILHDFGSSPSDGWAPTAGLVRDAGGNFYGTTGSGGTYGWGTIFELTLPKTYKILYSFTGKKDGRYPNANLVVDSKGNLYGTTTQGGSTFGTNCSQLAGCGTVFELTTSRKESVLHSFDSNGRDGYYAGSITLADGHIYGVTSEGGLFNGGTAFELTHHSGGDWGYNIVYNFASYAGDAALPSSVLTPHGGDFYGTSAAGGSSANGGTVFRLISNSNGVWTDQLLVNFNVPIGRNPYSGVIFNSKGALYAAAVYNGGDGCGTVVELTATLQTLWNFQGGLNGCNPLSPLTFDSLGNVYGTARGGAGFGVVYEVIP